MICRGGQAGVRADAGRHINALIGCLGSLLPRGTIDVPLVAGNRGIASVAYIESIRAAIAGDGGNSGNSQNCRQY